jgi:hypothetical protein
MSDTLPPPAHATKKIAQDASGTIFSRGSLLWYPPFSTTRILKGIFRVSTLLENFARWKTVWTLTSLWTQRTRPQGTWKLQNSFHSAHTDHPFYKRKKNNEECCKCANLIVSTEGFTPRNCAPDCALTDVYSRQTPPLTGKH